MRVSMRASFRNTKSKMLTLGGKDYTYNLARWNKEDNLLLKQGNGS